MNLMRPSTPTPGSPRTYVAKKARILARVRDAIQARQWECEELHAVYPSIRLKTFEALMVGEEAQFSIQFACAIAEAVGIDPRAGGPPLVLPTLNPFRPSRSGT